VTSIRITRAGPLCTVQDAGRFGMLRHGVSASGPMDRAAFERAAGWMGGGGKAGIEFTTAGIGFVVEGGSVGAGFDGGSFKLALNGKEKGWPYRVVLKDGDAVEITPGAWGNYGYLRFDRELDLAPVMGSLATNSVAILGGLEGRALRPGDTLAFGSKIELGMGAHPRVASQNEGPIRVVWGLHADLFEPAVRGRFAEETFAVSTRLDRMGARLTDRGGVFAGAPPLSLVSDAIVPGDIQILGDGTPIVLLRDHQPTGGYPRIATVITADLDRFAQLRPGTEVRFEPISLPRAQALMKGAA
jgi:biotin-dependent carboxylase-like uncharacterized protein